MAFEESISLNIIANPAKGEGLNRVITQLITIETKLANIAKLSAGIRPLALGAGAGIIPGQAGGLPAGQAQFGFMGQVGQAAKATETLNQKTQGMQRTFINTQKATAQYGAAITETTNKQGQLIRTHKGADGALTKVNHTTGQLIGSTKKLTKGFLGSGQAFSDIIKKVAVWTIATTMIFKLVRSLGDMVKEFIEFTQVMARVQTVTRATIGTLDQDMERLAASVYTYMRKSSASFKDTGEALYHLGSAGMDVREQMAGLAPIMNLTIATFGNLTEVARLAAGSYNVFGQSIEGAMTTAQKFKYISDLLAFTYSKQQVELSEIANAMTLVGSAAGVMQIPFSVLVGTIGELNTGMLKGTRAGTSLMNAFIALAQKSGQLKTQFGLVFDPSAPLDFVDIMEQMHAIFGDSAISLEDMGSLMQTFGRRGGRAIASILGRFEEWRTTVGKTEADFRDFADEMRETAEDTLPKQFSKLFNLIKTTSRESFRPMEDSLKNILQVVNKTTEAMERQQKAARLAAKIGTGQEAREIPAWTTITPSGAIVKFADLAVKKMQELQKETKEAQKNVFEYALIGAGLEETVNEIYETEKETNKERKERKDLQNAILRDEKLLEEILKSEEDVAIDIQGAIGDIVRETSKQHNLTKKQEGIYSKILMHLAEQYESTGSIGTATSKLTKEIERQSELIKEQSRYRLMAVQGASELEIAEEKIAGWIAEQERKLAAIPKTTREAKKEEIERAETLLKIAKTEGLSLENSKELVKALVKTTATAKIELKIQKLLINAKEKRIAQEERIRNAIKLTHKYNMMQLQGYTEIAVIQAKINDLVEEINRKGRNGLFTAELKIKLLELENEKIEAIQQRINDVASALRDDIAAGLDDIITKSGTLEETFISIGNVIRKEMINTLVESSGLIRGFTQGIGGVATGQGGIAGAGEQIKVAFTTGGGTAGENIKTDIVSAGVIAGKRIKADIVAASQAFRSISIGGGDGGGVGGMPTGWMPMGYQPGVGVGGMPTGAMSYGYAGAQAQGLKFDRLSGKMVKASAVDRQGIGGAGQGGMSGMMGGMMGLAGAGMAGYAAGGTKGAIGGMAGMGLGMALTPILGPLGPIVGALIGMAIGGRKKEETVTSTWQPQRAEEAGERGFRGEGYAPLERLYPLPESAYFSGRAGGQGMGMDNSIHIRIDNVNGDAEGIANRIADTIERKVATKYRRSLNRGINITFPRA